LANFDGPAHSRVVEEFRNADLRHIKTTPARIKRKVAEHVVAVKDAYPQESALVQREAAKKTPPRPQSASSSRTRLTSFRTEAMLGHEPAVCAPAAPGGLSALTSSSSMRPAK